MRIDEDCINHNVTRLIEEYTQCIWEIAREDSNEDHVRLMTLGYIRGVVEMGKVMKEVLKTK